MILRGQRAVDKVNEYFEDASYERIQWFFLNGYFEPFSIAADDWNHYVEALFEDDKLQVFFAFNFHRHQRYATLSLVITEYNKINFFKIINYIKKKAEQFKFIDYIEFNLAYENEQMRKIVKKLYKRYNNLYFLGKSLNNQAQSILGNQSPIIKFVYFIRDKDKYLNESIITMQYSLTF
jgi:hypothetical protein